MRIVLSEVERNGDDELTIFSVGSVNTNNHATEFVNIAERTLKAQNVRAKVRRVPVGWMEENISDMDYFAYFSLPKENVSPLVDLAESHDIDAGIFRY
jgi:hypothetical protein